MNAQEAVTKINALRRLTADTGTITTRTQSKILQSLNDDALLEVAVALQVGDALAGIPGVQNVANAR